MAHPREHSPNPLFLQRRELLRLAGAVGLALPAANLLTGCGGSDSTGGAPTGSSKIGKGGVGGAPYPLPRLDAPVTWAITEDNPAIASNLPPEKGPLRIFGYADFVYSKVLNAFKQEYGVEVEYSKFATADEMVAKLQIDPSAFDLIVTVTLDNLGKTIAGKLIQPLNRDYLTNFGNLWRSFQDPFYDQGANFTIPYTVYTSGLAWRNDLLDKDLAAMGNPYDILWDEELRDRVHVLNGSRELLALGLLAQGETDVNTEHKQLLDAAKQGLLEGATSMNWKFDHVDYNELTKAGEWVVHEAWSGQVAYYKSYLPKGLLIENFSYLWPPQGKAGAPGLVANDVLAVTKGSKSPVLAHALIDMLLSEEYATMNYGYEGYQPPLNFIDPDKVVAEGIVPANLANIVLTEDFLDKGQLLLEMPPAITRTYQEIYQEITGGV